VTDRDHGVGRNAIGDRRPYRAKGRTRAQFLTKSEGENASIEARVMRAIGASEKMPSVQRRQEELLEARQKTSPSPATRLSMR